MLEGFNDEQKAQLIAEYERAVAADEAKAQVEEAQNVADLEELQKQQQMALVAQ